MKKIFLVALLIISTCFWAAAAKNDVEVDFRVFSGAKFVDNLKITDIQVLQDGKPQTIDALYQVKGREIVNMEGLKKKPKTKRLFIFVFCMRRYSVRIDEALDYFFNRVIASGDALTFLTPENVYNMRGPALRQKKPQEIAHQLKGLLRRDVKQGNHSYLKRLEQLKEVVTDLSQGGAIQDFGIGLMKYADSLESVDRIRIKEQAKIIQFLMQQRKQKEKKFAFVFYERETKPDFTNRDMQKYMEQFNNRTDILPKLQGLFELYRREVAFNLKEVGEKFAASGLLVNFVNVKTPFLTAERGVTMNEYSEDAMALFSQFAQATGGIVEHSANPGFFFKKAEAFSNCFYSLRYVPSVPEKKKKFRKLEIKIKNKKYKITHCTGY